MANHRSDYVEDEEALFSSNASPILYYVQSPSTASHANSVAHDPPRFVHSRYPSHGSTKTFHHEKKISYDLQSHVTSAGTEVGGESGTLLRKLGVEEERIKHVDGKVDGQDDDYGMEEEKRETEGCSGFFSFEKSDSCCWISIQLSWRLLVSFGAALFVFFLATNPPPPTMFMKVAGIPRFGLGEGVDASGVTTKILNCNCSMALNIENKSKLFGLHTHPSIIQMAFGPFVFATSQIPKLYAESHESSTYNLYVDTKNKAMYGAGGSMQDMLRSRKGLPLIIQLRLRSKFKVVWNIINPKFHHHIECELVLHGEYNSHRSNQAYSSSCRTVSL